MFVVNEFVVRMSFLGARLQDESGLRVLGGDPRYSDLAGRDHVIGELSRPRSMSLVDLQCWVIKLFGLHPETQDLIIKGFFIEDCPLVPDLLQIDLYRDCHYLMTDAKWASYVKKVKRRNDGMPVFVPYLNCSEIKHHKRLFNAGYDAHSQVSSGNGRQPSTHSYTGIS